MRFARGDDYRAALRDHRSLLPTLLLFASALAGVLVIMVFMTLFVSVPTIVLWPAMVSVAVAVTWADAAHLVAGRRLTRK